MTEESKTGNVWKRAGVWVLLAGSFCPSLAAQALTAGTPAAATSTAYDDSALQLDTRITNSTGTTPLILIHGIHGNKWPKSSMKGPDSITDIYPNYFFNLILSIERHPTLKNYYKVYRFQYVSDKYSVSDIAQALGRRIDEASLNAPLVIIAHSMGGLVARAYMNEYSSGGQWGGDRVSRLITLATPHHGTPAASGKSRDNLASLVWWPILDISSFYYWRTSPQYYNPQLACALCAFDSVISVDSVPVDQPNRKDLWWDNYDGRIQNTANPDINGWLDRLNKSDRYLGNVTSYYGYIIQSQERGYYITRWGATLLFPWYDLVFVDVKANSEYDNENTLLTFANIVMDFGLKHAFPENDGFVPRESASLSGLRECSQSGSGLCIQRRVGCTGFDHKDMRDWMEGPCDGGKSLFGNITVDLLAAIPPTKTLAVSPVGPVDYGNIAIGSNADKVLTLQNSGSATLRVSGLTMSGTNSAEFGIVTGPTIPFDITPGSLRQVTVRFLPSTVGTKSATLAVTNDSDNSPNRAVSLSGSGTQASCTYTLSANSQAFGASGTSGASFVLTTASGCAWRVITDVSWTTISSPVNGSGIGPQTLSYSVAANSGSSLRVGHVTILGGNLTASVTVSQDGSTSSCTYFLSSSGRLFGAGGGADTFTVLAPAGCSWTVSANAGFVTINSPPTGTGSQTVTYSVAPNSTNNKRFGLITIQAQNALLTFTVTEDGLTPTCTYSISSSYRSIGPASWNEGFTVSAPSGCTWKASSTDGWITVNLPSDGNGSGAGWVSYSVAPNATIYGRVGAVSAGSKLHCHTYCGTRRTATG